MQLALANEREQKGHVSVSPATVVKVCVTVQSASTLNKGDSAAQKRYKVDTQNKQKKNNLKQKKKVLFQIAELWGLSVMAT